MLGELKEGGGGAWEGAGGAAAACRGGRGGRGEQHSSGWSRACTCGAVVSNVGGVAVRRVGSVLVTSALVVAAGVATLGGAGGA